jgi:hypothetical protein
LTRRAPCPALADLRREASVRPLLENSDPIRALHHLIIALHAPFAALVLRLDERLDAPEQRGSAPPGSATGGDGVTRDETAWT